MKSRKAPRPETPTPDLPQVKTVQVPYNDWLAAKMESDRTGIKVGRLFGNALQQYLLNLHRNSRTGEPVPQEAA